MSELPAWTGTHSDAILGGSSWGAMMLLLQQVDAPVWMLGLPGMATGMTTGMTTGTTNDRVLTNLGMAGYAAVCGQCTPKLSFPDQAPGHPGCQGLVSPRPADDR